jgi:hypothetical protein
MSPNLIAAAEGIVLGVVTAAIWRSASAKAPRVEFWAPVADLARSIAGGGDERDFLRQYGRVLQLLARYLGRQALILGVSFLPVTLFVMLLVPYLHAPDVSTTIPEHSSLQRAIGEGDAALAGTGDDEGQSRLPSRAETGTLAPAGGEVAAGSLVRDSENLESPQPGDDLALAAFAEVHTVRRQTAETFATENNDRLWSWFKLSEWEISFYVALSVASAAGMLVLSRRPV